MALDDDARPTGRTPSGWHDDASSRDAGHDEMQAAMLRWWRRNAEEPILDCWPGEAVRDFFLTSVSVEFPFLGFRGRVAGFADLALQFGSRETPEEEAKRTANYYAGPYAPRVIMAFAELKPRIGSVGGLIRQCAVTRILARDHFRAWSTPPKVEVWAVVYEDDPKVGLLEEMFEIGSVIRMPRGGK